MQTDFGVRNSDVGGNAITAQPLIPQLNRLRWEQEWLAQNNKAFAVIDGNQASTRSATTADVAMPPHLNRTMLSTQDVQVPQGATTKILSSPEAAHVTIASSQSSATVSRRFDVYAFAEVAVEPNNLWSNDASAPTADTMLSSATEVRRTLRNFAWWRNGTDISVAMRVAAETEQTDTVVRTLRQWLKEAGMNLFSVIVNGKVKGQ